MRVGHQIILMKRYRSVRIRIDTSLDIRKQLFVGINFSIFESILCTCHDGYFLANLISTKKYRHLVYNGKNFIFCFYRLLIILVLMYKLSRPSVPSSLNSNSIFTCWNFIFKYLNQFQS